MRNSHLPGGKGDDAGGWGRGRGPAVCETLRENLWLQKITDVLQNFVTQFSLAMSDFKALEKVVPLQFSVDSKVFQDGDM